MKEEIEEGKQVPPEEIDPGEIRKVKMKEEFDDENNKCDPEKIRNEENQEVRRRGEKVRERDPKGVVLEEIDPGGNKKAVSDHENESEENKSELEENDPGEENTDRLEENESEEKK